MIRKFFNPFVIVVCLVFLPYQSLFSSCCKMPEKGLPGPAGSAGPAGPPGPTGPAGPISRGNFGSLSFQTMTTVMAGMGVAFDMVNVLFGNLFYNFGNGTITLIEPGYYSVKYGISADVSNQQFVLKLNGVDVPGGAIDSQANQMQGVEVIFQVTFPMSNVQLINNSGMSVNLSSMTPNSVTAYLVIEQVF